MIVLADCQADCLTNFDTCKSLDGVNKCKRKKKRCKKACARATLCR